MKKLQSLMSTKFEPLSADAMRFIVGGEACASPGGSVVRGGETIKYSADTKDGTATTYNVTTDKSTATTSCEPVTPVTGGVTK